MNLLCFDLETYGSCTHSRRGTLLPKQTVFHPVRSLHTDLVAPRDLVLTCCISPVVAPSLSVDQWICPVPASTHLFYLDNFEHIRMLAAWFDWADALLGMNILFDLTYSKAFNPLLATSLSRPSLLLLDLAAFNYIHSELRPERSLKALGPVLGTHTYKETLKNKRFPSPTDPSFVAYAASDPHNTLLATRELTIRTATDYPNTPKNRGPSIQWFSNLLHVCLHMQEAGIPFDTYGLSDDLRLLTARVTSLQKSSPIPLSGPGSHKAQDAFYSSCIEATNHVVLSHPMVGLTPKKQTFSRSDANRNLLLAHLQEGTSDTAPLRADLTRTLEHLNEESKAQKLISTYLFPLLHHKRNDPDVRNSTILPWGPPATSGQADWSRTPRSLWGPSVAPHSSGPAAGGAAWPTWYPVPSEYDSSSESGGTIQGRITVKNPAGQTFPRLILARLKSRWPGGYILAGDLSQIELRVAALLSGDDSLLRNYNEGRDLHTDYTLEIFGPQIINEPNFKTIWRQVGKKGNFENLYLASPHRMQLSVYEEVNMLLPLPFFEDIVARRPTSRPGLWKWQQSLLTTASTDRRLILPFTGHSRTFMGGASEHRNEIVNFPIQTTAGNVLLDIQWNLLPWLRNNPLARMFLQIYDSIWLDCPPTIPPEVATAALQSAVAASASSGYWSLLQSHTGRSVPLILETKIQR